MENIYRVANTSESKTALFPAQKGQNPPPIFIIKKMTPYVFFNTFLLHFYVTIFPIPTENCKKYFDFNTFP